MLTRKRSAAKISAGLVTVVLFLSIVIPLSAIQVGQKVANVHIRDANDQPAWIPDLGRKVITIFYTDPDVKDQNDPFADMLKAAKLPEKYYKGIGVANLKDTWKPSGIIRVFVRQKIKKYNSTILTDPEHLLKKAWRLGDCNEKSVVVVIDRNRTVRYFKKGALSGAEQKNTFRLIRELIAESEGK